MRARILIAIAVLNTWWVVPGHAQEARLPFNAHIGGGFGVPLSSIGKFAGLSGAFQIGAGPNLTKHNSLFGEFMWQGLPANRGSLAPAVNPLVAAGIGNSVSTANNLYALTANYEFHMERRRYGFYLVAGGGWYYRHLVLKDYTVQPGTICEPVWDWYGYTCVNGLVSTSTTLASHYSPQGGRVSTQVVPVTFGVRW